MRNVSPNNMLPKAKFDQAEGKHRFLYSKEVGAVPYLVGSTSM
jgi:hypothetical protein